jgi:predicted phosphoribosyltransferase
MFKDRMDAGLRLAQRLEKYQGRETARDLETMADEVVILEIPRFFQAVAQVYQYWTDLSDEDVIRIIKEWDFYKKNEGAG